MVKGRKITKKQLKEPDEFITLAERAFDFTSRHTKWIAAGGILILVLILAVVFFRMEERKKEEEAAQVYAVASEMFERGIAQRQEGSAQDYKDVLAKFNEIVTKFPRTSIRKIVPYLYRKHLP